MTYGADNSCGQLTGTFYSTIFENPKTLGECMTTDIRLCSLSDLTQQAFERLNYPREELLELRVLETQYKERVKSDTQDRLDRERKDISQKP